MRNLQTNSSGSSFLDCFFRASVNSVHSVANRNPSALERARKDLSAGRPDLARDRVTGYLYTLHRRGQYDQNAYLLLGEILYSMRDYPRAGAAWLLTEKSGPEFDQSLEAFQKRYGKDAANMLRQVKPHAPSEDYPPAVQERLKTWDYRYKPYRPRSNPHALHEEDAVERAARPTIRPIELGCAVAALMFIASIAYFVWASLRR